MISLTNHHSQWGRSEVVIIYPGIWERCWWYSVLDFGVSENLVPLIHMDYPPVVKGGNGKIQKFCSMIFPISAGIFQLATFDDTARCITQINQNVIIMYFTRSATNTMYRGWQQIQSVKLLALLNQRCMVDIVMLLYMVLLQEFLHPPSGEQGRLRRTNSQVEHTLAGSQLCLFRFWKFCAVFQRSLWKAQARKTSRSYARKAHYHAASCTTLQKIISTCGSNRSNGRRPHLGSTMIRAKSSTHDGPHNGPGSNSRRHPGDRSLQPLMWRHLLLWVQ